MLTMLSMAVMMMLSIHDGGGDVDGDDGGYDDGDDDDNDGDS
jgi:hypothetical protein